MGTPARWRMRRLWMNRSMLGDAAHDNGRVSAVMIAC